MVIYPDIVSAHFTKSRPLAGLLVPAFCSLHVCVEGLRVCTTDSVSDGHITSDHSDPYIEASSTVMQQFSEAAAPGRWLVDLVPIRK
jgi:hypothetical protein